MTRLIQQWYNFALQQVAAESYLPAGSNYKDGLFYGNNKLDLNPDLTGKTRMTTVQAGDFLNAVRWITR